MAGLDGTPPTQALVLDPQFNNTSNRQKTTVRKTKNDLAAILLNSRQMLKADGQPVQTINQLIESTGISKKVYFYMRYGAYSNIYELHVVQLYPLIPSIGSLPYRSLCRFSLGQPRVSRKRG